MCGTLGFMKVEFAIRDLGIENSSVRKLKKSRSGRGRV